MRQKRKGAAIMVYVEPVVRQRLEAVRTATGETLTGILARLIEREFNERREQVERLRALDIGDGGAA